jgi:hypothetical protein
MAADKQRRAFISYSRTNKEFATKLAKGLRSAGYPVWFDQFDIPTGSRWDDEVEKALRECSIFMIILTSTSVASENVKDEIGYAIDHGKRILPVLLENCEVPLRLRRFQYVDFTTKSFEEGFESAKELLKGLIDETSVPIPAEAPLVDSPIESKPKQFKANPAPAMPVQKKVETISTGVVQRGPISMGLVIGIVAVVVLVIAGVGYVALSNRATAIPPIPIESFVGTWLNNNSSTRDWTKIEITSEGGALFAHIWGACHPTDCDAGIASATYNGNPARMSIDSGFAIFSFTFSLNESGNTLHVTTFTHYTDNSGREDMTSEDDFHK